MNGKEVIEESAEVVDEAEEITEEEIEDTAEESDEDYDFEYDDEGDIVVPEDEYDEDEEDNSSEDEDTESEEEEPEEEDSSSEQDVEAPSPTGEGEAGEGSSSDGPSGTPVPTKGEGKDERDEEIARLKKEFEDYKSDTRAAVKKLGGKSENPLDDLERMAAETEGNTLEKYRADRASEKRVEEAQALVRNQQFERIAAADLAELHAAYPETRQYKHVRELPDDIRRKFGTARNAGFSAKEAYAAANPDGVRATVATAVKKQAQHDSKAHLKSSVPKGSKDTGVKMTRSELLEYREMFPGLSDKEINDLYKKANK